ncbi:hypothetical protein EHQ58_03295 [Leptospira ognonensis]|uniref:Svf1-like C-terminal domain-containing protein n=1 Tax=Leptospira ognonensis TaxID=2484945 RepID=A0A4R9K985_9LEPT|nr:hypothetical protein [Leptospira ognonensis]TGL62242.1 hypothetical protein EHQ58_03295 [Leptospira ognonensis]
MFRTLLLFLFCFLTIEVTSQVSQPARLSKPADFRTQLYKEEGYLQAWNFSLQNETYKVFCTFLVSNFGPGSKNNGISVLVKQKDRPVFYSTLELDEKDFAMKPGQFFQQSGENWMNYKEGKYSIHMVFPDWIFDLDFTPTQKAGVAISGGKLMLTEEGKFIQADIPVSFAKVTGNIFYKGVPEYVEGTGGIEHLLTNYEVYKFSKKWEIARAITSDGTRILTGGFIGTDKIPGGFFRKVAVMSKGGELLLEGTVTRSEVMDSELEPTSGYSLPKKERVYFGEGEACHLDIIRTKTIAAISALENISNFLRFFIQLFFAKPYQIQADLELEVKCDAWSGKGKGFHSYYLINR